MDGVLRFLGNGLEKYQIVIVPDISSIRDWPPRNRTAQISVEAEVDLPLQIVDSNGFLVAQGEIGRSKVLSFVLRPDFLYMPPPLRATRKRVKEITPYQGRHYILEIFTGRDVEFGRPYKIHLEIGMQQ